MPKFFCRIIPCWVRTVPSSNQKMLTPFDTCCSFGWIGGAMGTLARQPQKSILAVVPTINPEGCYSHINMEIASTVPHGGILFVQTKSPATMIGHWTRWAWYHVGYRSDTRAILSRECQKVQLRRKRRRAVLMNSRPRRVLSRRAQLGSARLGSLANVEDS